MKKLVRNSLSMLILAVWIWPAAAGAQMAAGITFSTKFPFTAGNTKFPAGNYTIKPVDTAQEFMEITGTDGKAVSAFFETLTTDLPNTPAKNEIVFKKYGENYVLGEIHEAGSRTGRMSLKTHAENQHAKKSGPPTKETVATAKIP